MSKLSFNVDEVHFPALALQKEAILKNNYGKNRGQTITNFSINGKGRTLLIGIDYNPALAKEQSIHTVVCNGEKWDSEGWSCVGSREKFIESALLQVKKMLELVIPE